MIIDVITMYVYTRNNGTTIKSWSTLMEFLVNVLLKMCTYI